ncbi:hypothetical protein Pcinc_037924 [Petrolisthes cinctipes]|uniref:Endoglucanase n=1 Tax=Petrolisthes cinctipes TaxID=88211 RepID=A0AAE1BT39_PETCI|nr:hypothetical protein Pcinc_037924 [Petrolisthes cinctipes]
MRGRTCVLVGALTTVLLTVGLPGGVLGNCGGTFLAENGTIKSPNYPKKYPNNKLCVYTIKASPDARIKFWCEKMNLEKSVGCTKDWLCVNGLYTCGKYKLKEVYGEGEVRVEFRSDASVKKKPGFLCFYVRVRGGEYVATTTSQPTTTMKQNSSAQKSSTSCRTKYDYDNVLHKSLLFYEAQRSGYLPTTQRVTWRHDSATDDAIDADTQRRVDLEGGYYDAGDHVKFGFPIASAATVLTWGAIEYGDAYKAAGEMPEMLAAVKWITDYFLKAHVEPNVLYGQVGKGQLDHGYWGRPEDMTMDRPAYKITASKPGSDLAGETAAALAAAAILFQQTDPTYSATCLQHARELYNFADTYRGKYSDSITDANQFYKGYGTYVDELAWAASWLYRATGKSQYLQKAQQHYANLYPEGTSELSWADKTAGVMRTWGSTQEYRLFAEQQIHYMLGDGGRSYVVGFGHNPPERPHHKSSSCQDPPASCSWNDFHSTDPNPQVLYGALVGGPNKYDNFNDVRSDYVTNEVTCDYNAGFQSTVAGLRYHANCDGKPITTPSPSCSTKYDYDNVLHKSLLFYEAQRSGYLPTTQRVTWRHDSATDDAIDADTQQRVDLEGGYYDAGDHVKFGFPIASAATVLTWGAIEYGDAYKAAGEMPEMLAAVKWITDYFLKAHVEPNVLYGQVGKGQLDHGYWGRPEDMTMDRPAYKITASKPGSDLAGETAAALAAAAILFQQTDPTYSATCLQHARELYNFADTYRGKYSDSITDANQFYKGYGTYVDELAWAASWLYRATGKSQYLQKAQQHYANLYPEGTSELSWADKTAGVMVLLLQLSHSADQPTYRNHLEAFCERMIKNKPRTPKGLLFISKWGSLRYAANVVFVCLRAADLGINTEEYRLFAEQQIHYMLGDGGRSYVVGFGHNPPERPHHRSSSCQDPPASCSKDDRDSTDPNPQVLYGALVGGPDRYDNFNDVRIDHVTNEVTCDYNAGFQSTVAGLRYHANCG